MKREVLYLPKAKVQIDETDPRFPFGARGQRPVKFFVHDINDASRIGALKIPGLLRHGAKLQCTWDLAPEVCIHLGMPGALDEAYARRDATLPLIPGKARYKTMLVSTARREYQAEAALFLLKRAYGINADVPRAGKCIVFVAVHALSGSKKTLVICRALGKYVWAREFAQWAGISVCLLSGRAAAECKMVCVTCRGMKYIVPPGSEEAVACEACKDKNGVPQGGTYYEVRKLVQMTEKVSIEVRDEKAIEKNNQKILKWKDKETQRYLKWLEDNDEWEAKAATGSKKKRPPPFELKPKPTLLPTVKETRETRPVYPEVWTCRKHREVRLSSPGRCPACKVEFDEVIRQAEVYVCNYDILNMQKDRTNRGRILLREDLPGWLPTLTKTGLELVGLDEVHCIRGWTGKSEDDVQSKADAVETVCESVERVYAITGTPSCGYVRDYWRMLSIISKGLWS